MSNNKFIGSNTFMFRDILYPYVQNDDYCKVKITINMENYDDNDWYYIIINFTYSSKKSHTYNPFYGDTELFEDGDDKEIILVKNSLSEKLVEYILMNLEDISKLSGRRTPQEYKSVVLTQAAIAWG